jgi:hypothetical protein
MLDSQEILIKGVRINSLSLVKKAIKLGADPDFKRSYALCLATEMGGRSEITNY